MKKSLSVFVLCVLLILPVSAGAQDVFVKKPSKAGSVEHPVAPYDGPVPTPEEAAPPPSPAAKQEEQAPAPEATIDDYANRYYENCRAQKHPILQGENLELLCGCTASQLPKAMTIEQVRQMQEDSADGQYQRNRMMLFVYAPCIEHPTRALVLDQCMNDPKVQAGIKNYKTVCNCLADNMATFMKERAPATIENAIKFNEKDVDPLRKLLESPAFDETSRSKMGECISLYELGQARQ